MKYQAKKIFNSLLILLIVILIIFQFIKIGNNLDSKNSLQAEVLKEEINNQRLENQYIKEKAENHNKNKKTAVDSFLNLKAGSSEILEELKAFDLKLIDFTTSEAELNLNLNGDFNSILAFINLIETKSSILFIKEFKLKRDSDSLFLFLKVAQKKRQ